MKYIILDGKKALHPFKNGVGAKTWEEVKDCYYVGMIVPKPFIVLDFDSQEEAEVMLKIIKGLDLKCRVMKTTRGIHVWFKSNDPWKCFTKTRLACGLVCDCRSHSKNSYVKIIDAGVPRTWLIDTPLDEVQEVPKWLNPVVSGNKFKFYGMGEGDGRNQELFSYIVYLQSKGFEKADIKECLRVINTYVFDEPLDESELESIWRDDAFKPKEQIKKQDERTLEKFDHCEFGDALIQKYHIKTLNGQVYIYEDGYYKLGSNIVERKMIHMKQNIKHRQRQEVLRYIKICTEVGDEILNRNPYIVNLKNTRIDLLSGNTLDFTSEEFEVNRLPVVYNPNAYSEDLDCMLEKLFCNDQKVMDLFEEMVGYCLIRNNKYHKAFMLYGSGSNGKSTILGLLKEFLGDSNYSAIELNKLSDRFTTAQIENKLANIGDDINSNMMRDTGTLKKLFSGDSLQAERKSETPFTLKPYATMLFSCNEIPKSRDKTDGLYRRWLFIPFNAKISRSDDDYDPMIQDKITTEEALSYLLNLAIRGARRLIANNGFTEPESVQDMLEQYQIDNSSTLTWIEEQEIDERFLLLTPSDEVYGHFTDWCIQSGIKNVTSKKVFFKEIIQKYGFCVNRPQRRVNGVRKRFFIQDLNSVTLFDKVS